MIEVTRLLAMLVTICIPMKALAETEDEVGAIIASGNIVALNEALVASNGNLNRPALQRLLGYSASLGNIDSINALLAAGADINGPLEGGWTAVGIALISGNQDAGVAMLELGADPFHPNDEGATPESIAKALGHSAFVEAAGRMKQVAAPTPAPDQQPPGKLTGKRWVQVYISATKDDALSTASDLLPRWPHTQVFRTQGGTYAVAIGTLNDPDQLGLIDIFKSSPDMGKRIPEDSTLVTGEAYVEDIAFDRSKLDADGDIVLSCTGEVTESVYSVDGQMDSYQFNESFTITLNLDSGRYMIDYGTGWAVQTIYGGGAYGHRLVPTQFYSVAEVRQDSLLLYNINDRSALREDAACTRFWGTPILDGTSYLASFELRSPRNDQPTYIGEVSYERIDNDCGSTPGVFSSTVDRIFYGQCRRNTP